MLRRFLPALVLPLLLFVACSGSDGTGSTGPDESANSAPTASLTHSPSNPEAGETVTLDASGSSDADGSIAEYRWDVDGDGSVDATTTGATRDHTYGSTGEKTPSVTVADAEGATAEASTSVQVMSANTAPTASLTHSPSNPETGETVTLDASGSSDPDGDVVEYRWDVDGDGTVDDITTISTYSHAYGSGGDYTARVTVVDNEGAEAQAQSTVQVASGNTAPAADLSHSPTNPSVGETVTFDASGSSDPDGSIVEYRWDFDGDGTVDNVTTISTYSYAYGSSGDYDATVTVYDEDGASDLATTTVQVN